MLYSDIRRQAQLHAGLDIDNAVGLWYLNDGMRVLATEYDTACLRQTATVTAAAGVWTDLPAGAIRVVDCRVDGADYDFYEASFSQIRFEESVTAELTYLAAPPSIDSDVTPTIHELYHGPLALYMAARQRQTVFADEEQDAMRLMSEFLAQAARADVRLSGLKGTRRIMRVGAFR